MKLFQFFESKELVSELLWFQRYISNHDLVTQLEIEGDRIEVFYEGALVVKWDATEARRIRTEVLTNAEKSRWYSENALEYRFELGEPVISTDAEQSALYAQWREQPFKLGEPAIAKDAYQSVWYARDTLHDRFELGEPTISKNAQASVWYAKDVLYSRFESGEPAIAKDAKLSQKYQDFLKTLI